MVNQFHWLKRSTDTRIQGEGISPEVDNQLRVCYDADMKRTTIVLPDDLAELLEIEARRTNRSIAEIVRKALASHLRGEVAQPKRLPFAALGRSGHRNTAREAEAILEREWGHVGRR